MNIQKEDLSIPTIDEELEKLTTISMDEVPNLKSGKYPERMMISLTTEAFQKLQKLKHEKRKDTSELVRILIDRTLEKLAV